MVLTLTSYYIAIALLFLVLNVVCKVSFAAHLGYLITAAGVFSAECINTSIEHFVDMQDVRIRPEIKLIKDIAAAAVLLICSFAKCLFIKNIISRLIFIENIKIKEYLGKTKPGSVLGEWYFSA